MGNFYFTFEWWRTGYNSSLNEHYIHWVVYAHNAPGYYRMVYYKNLWVGGTQKLYESDTASNGKKYYDGNVVASGDITVGSYNSAGDGNFSASFDAGVGAYPGKNCNGSGSWDLDRIPRYANVSISANSRGLNTLTYNCSIDAITDWKQYRINGGNWADDGASNTIRNLAPNTTYSIQVRVRRADSQLWSESNTISMTTYDIARITSAPSLNIGSSHDITWSNPSGSEISLKLCKTDGTLITDYGKVTGTSKKITPDASAIYKLTPNSNTITLRYIITTAGTYTAYKDCVFTVINSNPIFEDFEYQDINSKILALTGNNQILVRGYSDVEGIISPDNKATAINSATMKSYKLLIGDKNATVDYSDSKEIKATINGITNNVIDMYAIDSRGNSTKVSKTATIKDYTNIKVISVKAERENNVGEAVTLSFEGKFWNENFGSVDNVVTSCIYKYKETSSSEYVTGETELTYTVKDEKITGSISIKGDLGAKGFDASNSYNIQVIIADKITEDIYEITLGSGSPAIAIYKNKVAIGQKYDKNLGGALQIKGEVYINEKLLSGQNITTGVEFETGLIIDGKKEYGMRLAFDMYDPYEAYIPLGVDNVMLTRPITGIWKYIDVDPSYQKSVHALPYTGAETFKYLDVDFDITTSTIYLYSEHSVGGREVSLFVYYIKND